MLSWSDRALSIFTSHPVFFTLSLLQATSSTGSEPAPVPSAVVPRRPETRERTNGRVAMTNLRPETMHRMRTQLQEHELHEKAKRKGKGKGKGKDKPRDAGEAQNATAEAAAAAVASQEMLSLRVAVAPQCTRHLMTFKDTVKERNFTSAKLAMFEHVKGSRVADGLYPQYYLPNGEDFFHNNVSGCCLVWGLQRKVWSVDATDDCEVARLTYNY